MAFMDDIVMRNQLPLLIWFEVKVLTMGEENFKILSKRMNERYLKFNFALRFLLFNLKQIIFVRGYVVGMWGGAEDILAVLLPKIKNQ